VRLAAALTFVAVSAVAASRAPEKGCAWKTLSSPELGLEVSVQRCDFGYRVIEFLTLPRKRVLYQSMQDTGKKASLYPVVTVFTMKARETPDAAIKRVALGRLSWYKRKHCLVVPRRLDHLAPGKAAFTLSPDKKYAAAALEAAGGDIPEPPCGEFGELADGLTYFEFHPAENPARFLFVDAGQDTPLFDETSLKLLP
jgi:hypothetical protein